MAEPELDIERIVRDVLARLAHRAGQPEADARPGASSPRAPAAGSDAGQRPEPRDSSTLVLSSPVITLADVAGRLEGVRRVEVPPRAVVTPAVRDELERHRVSLVYGAKVAARPSGAVRLALAVLGAGQDPRSLVAALEGESVEVEVARYDCLVAATDALAAEVARPASLAAALTIYPAAALCLANRHRGVRAVWGTDPARLDEHLDSVGANLLVLDPRASSPFAVKQMLIQFCRRGPSPCPEPLRSRLG